MEIVLVVLVQNFVSLARRVHPCHCKQQEVADQMPVKPLDGREAEKRVLGLYHFIPQSAAQSHVDRPLAQLTALRHPFPNLVGVPGPLRSWPFAFFGVVRTIPFAITARGWIAPRRLPPQDASPPRRRFGPRPSAPSSDCLCAAPRTPEASRAARARWNRRGDDLSQRVPAQRPTRRACAREAQARPRAGAQPPRSRACTDGHD